MSQAAQPNQQQTPAHPGNTVQHSDDLPAGYPKLAERMGQFPEKAVFRRFGFLNKLNILYLQAELMDIEDQLKGMQREDSRRDGCEKLYATDWYHFSQGDHEQLRLLRCAREKLERYNTALIQQSYILALKNPAKSDLQWIQRLLASPEMGPCAMAGLDAEVWGTVMTPKDFEPDIVSLAPRKKKDMFSNLIREKGMAHWFKHNLDRFWKSPLIHGQVVYDESILARITKLMVTALASLLPIVSIVILYFAKSMKARLGIIALFNVLTSFSLAFFTTARRTDIFAVAAAFSAVQVVFVQGDGVGSITTVDCSKCG